MSRSRTRARKNPRPKVVGKRKRDDADENSTQPAKKQASQRPEQLEHDEKLAHMDAAILADHFAQVLKRHTPNNSAIEFDDQYLPAKAFRDTSAFVGPRVAKNLPSFLEEFGGGKKQLSTCDDVASPHTIIIAASGIRVADLTRELRVFATEESKIAKLFAKHMKLGANIEFVQKTRIGIGIGTPSRLKELIEHDALRVAAIKRFVVDGSYMDEKRRTIFDFKEIYLPMIDTFNLSKVKERLGSEQNDTEVLVF